MTLVVPHMVHLQDVLKLHTFVLGDFGALLLACFGFDLRFVLVAFNLVSASIWCEGVGFRVSARGGSTCAGRDYFRGALGWERWANLRTTNKARSHTHTQAQATQPLNRGSPTPMFTALQQESELNNILPKGVGREVRALGRNFNTQGRTIPKQPRLYGSGAQARHPGAGKPRDSAGRYGLSVL